jgi:hypothetical protein
MGQFLEVKGQRRIGEPERFCDRTRVHSLGPSLNQKAEYRQPRFLCECRERRYDRDRFHDSNLME